MRMPHKPLVMTYILISTSYYMTIILMAFFIFLTLYPIYLYLYFIIICIFIFISLYFVISWNLFLIFNQGHALNFRIAS